jgi:hypothetical protein
MNWKFWREKTFGWLPSTSAIQAVTSMVWKPRKDQVRRVSSGYYGHRTLSWANWIQSTNLHAVFTNRLRLKLYSASPVNPIFFYPDFLLNRLFFFSDLFSRLHNFPLIRIRRKRWVWLSIGAKRLDLGVIGRRKKEKNVNRKWAEEP